MRASQAGTGHKGFPISGVTGDQAVSAGKRAILRKIAVSVPAAGNIVVKDGATTQATLTVVSGQPVLHGL